MTLSGALIAIDWGTSSLRAALLDATGAVLERRDRDWGIMRLPDGGYAAAWRDITRDWQASRALACGMVGSAQGWAETLYVPAPAGAAEIAAAFGQVRPPDGPMLHIVPGLSGSTAGGQPNVMRGEETQIVGALSATSTSGLFVLPGTHSKWVRVEAGRITAFETFMTGELFAALRTHTILGRPAEDAGSGGAFSRDAFTRGLCAARAGRQGLAPLLFGVRALVLARHIRAEESLDYLSGLLIGDELRAGLDLQPPGAAGCTLIGTDALTQRYRLAFELFGAPPPATVRDAALDGLRLIARTAGLLPAATDEGSRSQ